MKLWLRHLAVLLAVVGIGGVIVVVSGIVPISASSGHWPITRRFLEFSMERSVSTYSAAIRVPDLDQQTLIVTGAGHFETACVQCHSSPLRGANPVAMAMVPQPPVLTDAVQKWDPEELFYIVKHGIKFTGMPSWPASDRDDEIWAVVAFLHRLPDLDAAAYRSLVFNTGDSDSVGSEEKPYEGPPELRHLVTVGCGRCHGPDGRGHPSGAFPALAGQGKEYLLATLRAYQAGQRHSALMQSVAVPLTESEIQGLAKFYAQRPSSFPDPVTEETTKDDSAGADSQNGESSDVSRGAEIARNGVPSHRVPACTGCHGPGLGRDYPRIAGQPAGFLENQLTLFRRRVRGGTSFAHLMHPPTERITDDQIRSVALFYQSLRTTTTKAPESSRE